MSIFKCVHFFRNEVVGVGWSEVWYQDAPDFNSAVSGAFNVARVRVDLLAGDNILEWQRVIGNQPLTTQVRARQQRAAVLDRLDLTGRAESQDPNNVDRGDLPWTAIKIRWAATAVEIFRVQLLRGLPDSWFSGGNDKRASANAKTWANRMQKVLFANSMRIRHVVGPPIVPGVRDYSFVAPSAGTYEGYTRRATGRPFGLPRGRAPKRP